MSTTTTTKTRTALVLKPITRCEFGGREQGSTSFPVLVDFKGESTMEVFVVGALDVDEGEDLGIDSVWLTIAEAESRVRELMNHNVSGMISRMIVGVPVFDFENAGSAE